MPVRVHPFTHTADASTLLSTGPLSSKLAVYNTLFCIEHVFAGSTLPIDPRRNCIQFASHSSSYCAAVVGLIRHREATEICCILCARRMLARKRLATSAGQSIAELLTENPDAMRLHSNAVQENPPFRLPRAHPDPKSLAHSPYWRMSGPPTRCSGSSRLRTS